MMGMAIAYYILGDLFLKFSSQIANRNYNLNLIMGMATPHHN